MTDILPVKGGHLDWVFPIIKLTVKWDQLVNVIVRKKWILKRNWCYASSNVK